MKKQVLYTYLGTNGTVTTPVHLEDVYYVRSVRLIPEVGKKLTKDGQTFVEGVVVPDDEVELWREVKA